jgi:hypothetical protein
MYLEIEWTLETASIMLDAAMLLPIERHNEAIALDGLRVIFHTLKESTSRLLGKLQEAVTNTQPMEYGSMFFYNRQMAYTSIMSDIWVTVDNIYRMSLFIKLIPEINESDAGKAYNAANAEVKGLRDSLHHINERIEKHFTQVGKSILGDVLWRTRSVIGEREVLHLLFSGVHRKTNPSFHMGVVQPTELLHYTGLYDLRIQYVRKQNKGSVEEPIEVNISSAIKASNDVINTINIIYGNFLLTKGGALFENIPPGLTAAMIGQADEE